MKLLHLVCTLSGCLLLLSSSISPVATPPNVDALVNDSVWFGNAQALRLEARIDRPCTDKQFGLSIQTDIPHGKGYYNRAAPITGCMSKCLPTQLFSIWGVPLKVGRYDLAKVQLCNKAAYPARYMLLDGGDASVAEFNGREGWIDVTRYEPINKQIEGQFEATLRSSQGEVVRFTKGRFKTKLVVEFE